MKRKLRILWAHVRCNLYCGWHGLCKLTTYSSDGRTLLIAAVTGSIFKNNLEVHRTFYNDLLKP